MCAFLVSQPTDRLKPIRVAADLKPSETIAERRAAPSDRHLTFHRNSNCHADVLDSNDQLIDWLVT